MRNRIERSMVVLKKPFSRASMAYRSAICISESVASSMQTFSTHVEYWHSKIPKERLLVR